MQGEFIAKQYMRKNVVKVPTAVGVMAFFDMSQVIGGFFSR